MVEGTPGKPFGNLMSHFNQVESNMRRRRQEVQSRLGANEVPMTLTCFPLLGVPGFTIPEHKPTPDDPASAPQSLFFPDQAIFQVSSLLMLYFVSLFSPICTFSPGDV